MAEMVKRNSETVQRTEENLKITIINIKDKRKYSNLFLFHGCTKEAKVIENKSSWKLKQ